MKRSIYSYLIALFALTLSGGWAVAAIPKWTGVVDTDWDSDGNWDGSAPGVNDGANFNALFVSSNQPTMGAGITSLRDLRVTNPPQAVTITADGATNRFQLNSVTTSKVAILMSNASAKDLTITGTAEFRQRGVGSPTPEYRITGGGNLTISTGTFKIVDTGANPVSSLTVNVGTDRIVDFQTPISNGSGGPTAAGIIKDGPGRLIYGGANLYTGPTTMAGGILELAADNAISDQSEISIADATIEAGGFDGSFADLFISGATTLDFESLGTSDLAFADSSALTWSGTLNVVNYTDGSDTLRFGTTDTGLTQDQLDRILVNGFTVSLDASGFIVLGGLPPLGPVVISSYTHDPGTGESTVEWESATGQTYLLEGSTDLGQTDAWADLSGDRAGTGGTDSFPHTPAPPEAVFYYRVRRK